MPFLTLVRSSLDYKFLAAVVSLHVVSLASYIENVALYVGIDCIRIYCPVCLQGVHAATSR